jgi:hypothetical protein
MLCKLRNEATNGFIFKKFDEVKQQYPNFILFKTSDNKVQLAIKEEENGKNIKYCDKFDFYYFPMSTQGFRILVDIDKYDLENDYIELKRIVVEYKDKVDSFLLELNTDNYILNKDGDTMQRI